MMDAVEFLRKKLRMCESCGTCAECELWESEIKQDDIFEEDMYCDEWMGKYPEKAVAFVEKWSKEHPEKSRQSVFLEQYPEAAISKDGAIAICPLAISAAYRHGKGACNKGNSDTCADCKRQFWSAEVE